MNAPDIKKWLDENFEEHEEYLVEVREPGAPEGQHKYFIVSVEVSQQIAGALHEFTKGGGEIVDSGLIELDGADSTMSVDLDGLVISEHLFADEGAIDIPIVLDLPNPEKTPSEKIEARFEKYARDEGLASHIEQFGPDLRPDEISKELLEAAMEARKDALKDHDETSLPMKEHVESYLSEFINDQLEKHDLHDAYGDVYYSDDVPLRDFAQWADDLFSDLGIETNLEEGLRNAFEEGAMQQDKSSAMDWLDQEVVINFHPTVSSDGYLDEGMVTCDSISGDAFNVVPDEEFKAVLEFMNISGSEYAEHIKSISGGNIDLATDNDEWSKIAEEHGGLDAWCPKADPSKDSLVTLPNLVELIENTNGYGVFTWSINVNLKDVLSVPPGEKVSLSGGQIGFHDYANGSGHMEGYAVGSKEVQLDQIAFVPDELKRYGLDSVYGMTRSATDGDFKWPEKNKQQYLQSRKDLFIKNLKENINLPEGIEGVSVDESGHAYFVDQNSCNRYLTDIYDSCERMFGSKPDLDSLLTEADRKELKIKPGTPASDLNP